MPIKNKLEADIKSALLSGEKDKVTILRGIKSVILDNEIAERKRDVGLDDEQLILILSKEAKKRQEAADMYSSANETERSKKELFEKSLIEAYLPKQMDDDELSSLVERTIAEMGIKQVGNQDMGKIIAGVRKSAHGQADGSRIAAAVKSLIR